MDWTAWATIVVLYGVVYFLTWVFDRKAAPAEISRRVLPILLLVMLERIVHIVNLMEH